MPDQLKTTNKMKTLKLITLALFIAALSAATTHAASASLWRILNTADNAISSDCSSLFRGSMNAFGEEILGALFDGLITLDEADALVHAVMDYVALGYDAMDLFFPATPPPPKPCKVNLMLRR